MNMSRRAISGFLVIVFAGWCTAGMCADTDEWGRAFSSVVEGKEVSEAACELLLAEDDVFAATALDLYKREWLKSGDSASQVMGRFLSMSVESSVQPGLVKTLDPGIQSAVVARINRRYFQKPPFGLPGLTMQPFQRERLQTAGLVWSADLGYDIGNQGDAGAPSKVVFSEWIETVRALRDKPEAHRTKLLDVADERLDVGEDDWPQLEIELQTALAALSPDEDRPYESFTDQYTGMFLMIQWAGKRRVLSKETLARLDDILIDAFRLQNRWATANAAETLKRNQLLKNWMTSLSSIKRANRRQLHGTRDVLAEESSNDQVICHYVLFSDLMADDELAIVDRRAQAMAAEFAAIIDDMENGKASAEVERYAKLRFLTLVELKDHVIGKEAWTQTMTRARAIVDDRMRANYLHFDRAKPKQTEAIKPDRSVAERLRDLDRGLEAGTVAPMAYINGYLKLGVYEDPELYRVMHENDLYYKVPKTVGARLIGLYGDDPIEVIKLRFYRISAAGPAYDELIVAIKRRGFIQLFEETLANYPRTKALEPRQSRYAKAIYHLAEREHLATVADLLAKEPDRKCREYLALSILRICQDDPDGTREWLESQRDAGGLPAAYYTVILTLLSPK